LNLLNRTPRVDKIYLKGVPNSKNRLERDEGGIRRRRRRGRKKREFVELGTK